MVSNSLENPTKARLRKVYTGAFSMIFCAIMLTGSTAWITFGNQEVGKSDLIIFRKDLSPDKTDYFMMVGRFVLLASLIIFGGLRISPMKPMIFKALRMK
jgi:hypothetical protein